MTTRPAGTGKQVPACNYAAPASAAAKGTLCYVRWANWGGGNDRVPLLIRSRSGRLIEKWEDTRRLVNFRPKTIPPDSPLWARLDGWDARHLGDFLDSTRQAAARQRRHLPRGQ